MSKVQNVFGLQCHINNNVQAIIVDMVQGWIRDMSIKILVKLVVQSN